MNRGIALVVISATERLRKCLRSANENASRVALTIQSTLRIVLCNCSGIVCALWRKTFQAPVKGDGLIDGLINYRAAQSLCANDRILQ
jgi:hypothetical protein